MTPRDDPSPGFANTATSQNGANNPEPAPKRRRVALACSACRIRKSRVSCFIRLCRKDSLLNQAYSAMAGDRDAMHVNGWDSNVYMNSKRPRPIS